MTIFEALRADHDEQRTFLSILAFQLAGKALDEAEKVRLALRVRSGTGRAGELLTSGAAPVSQLFSKSR